MAILDTLKEIIVDARDGYHDAFSRGDHRTAGLPLVDSPWPTIIICCCYYVVCVNAKKIAPSRPYDLKYMMAAYNLIMVAVSGWMFYTFAVEGWLGPYLRQIRCPPFYPNKSNSYTPEQDRRILLASLMYYYTKYVEFLDTVFFVLRHKFDQMSYLHMVHHGLMPWGIYYQVKWFPTGAGTFIAFLNSGIHTIMYLYYGLAALGLHQRLSSWKKYMTRMQMIQFIVIFFYYLDLWLIESNFFGCNKVPTVVCFLACFSATMVFILFANFYITSYLEKRRRRVEATKKQSKLQKTGSSGTAETNGHANGKIGNGKLSADEMESYDYDDSGSSKSRRRKEFPLLCR